METVLGRQRCFHFGPLHRFAEAQRAAARRLGIAAMAMRVVLLFTIGWLTGLTEPFSLWILPLCILSLRFVTSSR